MANTLTFPPTRDAALARAAAINPTRYARTRNSLNGDVTRLSPYVTHGLISIPELLQSVQTRHALGWQDKIAFEFGWREYFHHAWERLGDGIWREPHEPPSSRYSAELPEDIRTASTGVAIIDQQVRELYATGYLHNHARMWIASYVVHMRKVSWQAGARWMYSHLLDGDLASNTLSWQWVAGTWTGKPYLFNAENVARYAPGVDCSGTVIDATYAELDVIARSPNPPPSPKPLFTEPFAEPARHSTPPEHALLNAATAPTERVETTWLLHPWSLHLPYERDERDAIGVINTDFHAMYPWSAARWRFVMEAMTARCARVYIGNTEALAARLAGPFAGRGLAAISTLNPFYAELIQHVAPDAQPAPRAFGNPTMLKRSFTSFWNAVSREKFPA
jgi:deoxyribodipyrimidine photo-lyase